MTTLRLTFSVGVSSPVSWERSWSRIANFLTCSTCAYFALAASRSPWISARTCAFCGQRGDRAVLDARAGLGPGDDLLLVERDQHHRVRAAVAVHHGLRDPAGLLEVVLEVGRREVLAARGDDDVLLAAGDRDEAVGVDRAEVAGVQPAVVDRAERRVVVLVVAAEDVRAADQQLAVVGDLDLDAGQRLADRAELWSSGREVVATVEVSVIP